MCNHQTPQFGCPDCIRRSGSAPEGLARSNEGLAKQQVAGVKGASDRRTAEVALTQAAKIRVTCPSCRTVLTSPSGRVRCSACRKILIVTAPPQQLPSFHQPVPRFGSFSPTASSPPATHRGGPVRVIGLAAGLGALSIAWLAVAGLGALSIAWLVLRVPSGANRGAKTQSQGGDRSTTTSVSGERTSNGSSVRSTIGNTADVRKAEGFWPCGSTPAAFDELLRWAVRGDNAELKRTMYMTHSFALDGGMKVKILGVGFGRRKVRVLTNAGGEAYLNDADGVFAADPRIGRECWVVEEALSE
jgi:LSD1 subclass zinc finger protein